MSVSVGGAALIAQIIPVLLLIVVVEAQALVRKGWPLRRSKWLRRVGGPIAAWGWGAYAVGSVVLGLTAVFVCVNAVAFDRPMPASVAGLALLGFFLCLTLAGVILVALAVDTVRESPLMKQR